jgi:DNA-binding IclR family transcriptional regulator
MSSLTRLLSILDFFGPNTAVLSAEEIIGRLGCSRPQGYRYIHELCAAGLLTRFSGAYSLGPRIIELDFVIRSGDPLLETGESLIRELRDRVGCDVLLASIFGDRIVAIHHERSDGTEFVGFGRGRPMPLFSGAGCKIILASLPVARQKRLFQKYPDEVEASKLGGTWEEFRAELRRIRHAGYALSLGELDSTNAGIAAPVFHEAGVPPAALIVVMPRARYDSSNPKTIAQIVTDAASRISLRTEQRCERVARPQTSRRAYTAIRSAARPVTGFPS